MKFSLSWLKEHLETDASLEEIVETMIRIGLEVEEVHDPKTLFADFKTAEIVSAEPHPDADKLKVCTVDTGTQKLQVVCGAPNARAGLKGIFAPVGSYVPGIDLELKKAKIRGVESSGMMASEREMLLSDAHDGIIDLPADTPLGVPMVEAMDLDDPVIDFEVTPNRPDWNGVDGIARDLAAAGLGTTRPHPITPVEGQFPCPIEIKLDFPQAEEKACFFFAGRLVRGVKNGPSPDWLQKQLKAIGLRPINALVDITNYISYDRARPLHVYDAAKLKGAIRARMGERGERFLALDGKTYEVDEGMCVIADDSGVLGLGGVIGGEASGCTEETVDVFIEAALFDPLVIAQTGRRLSLTSDARYRFERGVDPLFCEPGLELATAMVLDICGGEPSEVAAAGAPGFEAKTIPFRPARVKKLTGLDLPAAESVRLLEALGFAADLTAEQEGEVPETLQITVPSWRPDIEGEADLVEEVSHIHGFDKLPSTPLSRLTPVAEPVLTLRQSRLRWARRALASRGLREAVTYSFTRAPWAEALKGPDQPLAAVTLANPISSELSVMRPTVLANLLGAVKHNQDRGLKAVGLFEIGPQYAGDQPEDQTTGIGGVRFADPLKEWSGDSPSPDVYTAKADALAVLSELGVPVSGAQATADAPGHYHPGRSGVLRLGPKTVLATFGELHPRLVQLYDMRGPVVAFEISVENLPTPKAKTGKARPPFEVSDLMPLERDFAFLVDEAVTAETIRKAALGAEKKVIREARIFDIYAGKGIEPGMKSVAFSITIEPKEKTLTDDEIDKIMKAVIAAVEKATGGALRG